MALAGWWLSGDARTWWPVLLGHPWLASRGAVLAAATIIGWSVERRAPRNEREFELIGRLVVGAFIWGIGALIALLVIWIL